jgi:hypothetical protein
MSRFLRLTYVIWKLFAPSPGLPAEDSLITAHMAREPLSSEICNRIKVPAPRKDGLRR